MTGLITIVICVCVIWWTWKLMNYLDYRALPEEERQRIEEARRRQEEARHKRAEFWGIDPKSPAVAMIILKILGIR